MKIGILTQPLHSNYGGLLQNYALQQVLIEIGHQPITIDLKKDVSLFRYIFSTLKTVLLRLLGRNRTLIKYKTLSKRNNDFDQFVKVNIATTIPIGKLHRKIVKQRRLEALIVGSDQVWRPRYNKRRLPDMYLAFVKGLPIKRIAYAASFGVDIWEYTKRQERICSSLVHYFDAISVREDSGVRLCHKYLGIKANKVIDPTLLLAKEKYEQLCVSIRTADEPFIFAYILDLSTEKQRIIDEFVASTGVSVNIFSADSKASLSPEQWISMFRDASLVITDSFHGTCFSIIFEKEFYSIGNIHRGSTRFISLLETFNLQERYIGLPLVKPLTVNNGIDWQAVRNLKMQHIASSIKFLKDNLR